MRRALALALVLLAGCGDRQMLTPRAGKTLPPRPATSALQPNADQLLTTSATQRPGRSDELLQRSQRRRDDKFDLPPQ